MSVRWIFDEPGITANTVDGGPVGGGLKSNNKQLPSSRTTRRFYAEADPGSSENVLQAQYIAPSAHSCWIPDNRRSAYGFQDDDKKIMNRPN
jgi:hypothetical protein